MKRLLALVLGSVLLSGCATGLPISLAPQHVVYAVTGDGTANITYMTVNAGKVGQESANGEDLPWSESFELGEGLSYTALSLVAGGDENTTTISCKITVDGEVVSEHSSTGPFAIAGCTVSNR